MARLKRQVKIQYNLQRGFEASSTKRIDDISKSIEVIMNKKLENARNYTSRLDTKIGGGPGFNESLKLFSQSFHQRIQQRFLRNPKHWKPLSKTTKRIRSFLLNPNELLYLIMKWWNRSEEHTSELQSRENLVCR